MMAPRLSAKRFALSAISIYQGLRAGRASPCRFWPSCSAYAAEAIETYGAVHGGWLAVRRILRCHPFGGRGIDLVPIRVDDRGER
jgi:putative membrane protein insertion efficiency factor